MFGKFVKIFSAIMAVTMLIPTFAGCAKSEEGGGKINNDDEIVAQNNSIFAEKENVITDRQAYTENAVKFPDKLWTESVSKRAVSYDYPLYDVRAYFIQSVDYNGAPTNFFGYFGIPDTASAEKPVPAVVLVHGGGGTAYADWVQFWVKRGYAAIAIDTEGRAPDAPGASTVGSGERSTHSRNPGPSRNGTFLDSKKEVEEQWMYHAIASVISSVTFLSQMPEVDGGKIGCVGISWGSLIVSGTAIYDDRLAFVVAVYGSIGESGTKSREGIAIDLQPDAVALWDDESALQGRKTPFLFVNNHQDHAFSVEVQNNCGRYVENKQFCIITDLAHNHREPMKVGEIGVFADNICLNNPLALPEITVQPTATNGIIKTKTHGTGISYGILYSTADEEIISPLGDNKNNWVIDEIDCDDNGNFAFGVPGCDDYDNFVFKVPEDAKWYFVTVVDDCGNRSSTQLVKIGD